MKFRTRPDGSAMLDYESACQLTGQTLDPDYFTHWPFGHYLLVVTDKAPEMFGSLIIPDKNREKISAGYVIAVGPQVGDGSTPYPGGPRCAQPSDMLGRRVIFGLGQGSVLRVKLTQRDLWGEVLMLTDLMLRVEDENLEPVAERLAREVQRPLVVEAA